jgi:hypothetical protein
MSNIRFIDSVNVGAYTVEGGGGVEILDNVNNYIITATGLSNTVQGESQLQFDSLNLAIGGAPSGTARLEIYHTGSIDNLMLIRNTDTNTGIKVDNIGRFQLLEFSTLPSPIEGGIVYSSNEFYVGM